MLIGPLLAAAVVLGVAGVAKIARPEGTSEALRNAGLPSNRALVVAIGVFELALGTITVVWAPPAAIAALAVVYAVFAVFSIRLITQQGSAASCGCFGVADSPVHPVHVVVNILIAVTVAAALVWPPLSIGATPLAVLVGSPLLAAVLIIALTTLPIVLIAADEVLTTAPEES